MKLLENELVKLRALEPADVELLYEWENDTEIWTVSNTIAPFSKYLLKQYIENSHLSIYEAGQLKLSLFRRFIVISAAFQSVQVVIVLPALPL